MSDLDTARLRRVATSMEDLATDLARIADEDLTGADANSTEALLERLLRSMHVGLVSLATEVRRSLPVAVLLLVALAACGSAELGRDARALEGAVDVWLLAGQSNAVGSTPGGDLSAGNQWLLTPDSSIQYSYQVECPKDYSGDPCPSTSLQQRGWGALGPRGTNQLMGLELSAGRDLAAASSVDVAILKFATGGSNLAGHWDTGTDNSQWEYMVAWVDARMAELPSGSRVAGMLWSQGNGDASNSGFSGDYAENLAYLVARVRDKWSDGCLPVVIDRLSPLTSYAYGDQIRSEETEASLHVPDLAVVETDDLALRDTMHYNADSDATLGSRMVAARPECAP